MWLCLKNKSAWLLHTDGTQTLTSVFFKDRPVSLQVFYLFRLIFEVFPSRRTVCFWTGFKLNTISQMIPKLSATCQPYQLCSECSCQRWWTLLASESFLAQGILPRLLFSSAADLLMNWLSLVPSPPVSVIWLSLFVLPLHSFNNPQILCEHLLWNRYHVNC